MLLTKRETETITDEELIIWLIKEKQMSYYNVNNLLYKRLEKLKKEISETEVWT